MSVVSLRTQIKEDHLTCPICCNDFTRPKALPCLHTFCESCLRDYVVSRGYESAFTFPCPICRADCTMPSQGVEGFPNNHLMSSLSDTVEKSASSRPVPKPRRSLGVPSPTPGSTSIPGSSSSSSQSQSLPQPEERQEQTVDNLCEGSSVDIEPSRPNMHRPVFVASAPGPDDFEVLETCDEKGATSSTSYYSSPHQSHHAMNDVDNSPPPPYSSVADSKVCSNDSDPGWMFVPKQNLPAVSPDRQGDFHRGPVTYPSIPHQAAVAPMSNFNEHHSQPPVGWNLQNHPTTRPNENFPMSNNSSNVLTNNIATLYPTVQQNEFETNTVCSLNLILRFGKQGSTARDFIRPIGLAITQDGQFVISDNGGDQNRIMIFNSGGEITTAFKCGAKVTDVAVTKKNEVVASIDKNVSAFRLFTLGGQLKGEFGKFFTYERPSGIAELNDHGIVLTGLDGHCVYALNHQMKLSTKFGRKGNGDGYFLHPGFVAVDSKNNIIVTDKTNGYIQVFNNQGKFKLRFGSNGHKTGQLNEPLGVCVDSLNNIIVADSGNCRVEAFSPSGRWLCTIVKDTNLLGESVAPVNVAMTPTGKVAVLLRGPYFAEVRVYSSQHQKIPQDDGHNLPLIVPCWRL